MRSCFLALQAGYYEGWNSEPSPIAHIIAAIVEIWCAHCGADVGVGPGPAADKAVDLAVGEKSGALLGEGCGRREEGRISGLGNKGF